MKRVKKPLNTLSVERGHQILAHLSIRSLLTGYLHNVWEDYRFTLSNDNYCESCRVAARKVTLLSKRQFYIPKTPFQ